ncbi:FKBP-type peptidyl-prolyl cis-trans isomerase [Desulfosediminicola ganghwensis]|uniref:FKBP-type peptidyl-prolyl cis-trans isomerase n=1 Tax=Desulfosediminicola ganghwensis TaxID=2569540 RepID=UPI0010AC9C4B|nr:peptidylprolyl isomerase [Desulfosediminicola ganghwensis]
MQQVKNGDTVKVHYTGTLEDGSVFDSSEGHDPLEFTVGSGQVIAGFDNAVTGMAIGEKKSVFIPCAEAYGEANSDLVMTVPQEQVPPDLKPEVGMLLEVGGANGEVLRVTVVEVSEEVIILDANPPLAGKDLTFALELVSIG